MNTLMLLILSWWARRAEGRMKIINDEENFKVGRERRQSEAYYKRRPDASTVLKPVTVEQIEDEIAKERAILDATNSRIRRNAKFFSGK